MKPPVEWDEDYVLRLPAGEHDFVEFKSAKALDLTLAGVREGDIRRDLARQVSAFANTSSGSIVFGVANQAPGAPRIVDDFGGVSLEVKGGTKEWLEDVVPTLVDPLLKKFNVYAITAMGTESGIRPGRALIVLEIPLSENAPHQARGECVYYGRVSGKSRPLSHQFVIDILNRSQHPEMDVQFRIFRKGYRSGSSPVDPTIEVRCFNRGRVVAQNVAVFVDFPSRLVEEHKADFRRTGEGRVQAVYKNIREDIVGFSKGGIGSFPHVIRRYDPVLPRLSFRHLEDVGYDVRDLDLRDLKDARIEWKVYADAASPRSGSVLVRDIELADKVD